MANRPSAARQDAILADLYAGTEMRITLWLSRRAGLLRRQV
jgi:hypothetical protein